MTEPPSLHEVEQALLAMRTPYERQLTEIRGHRDRFLENHRQSSADVDPVFVDNSNRLRRSVRLQQGIVDRLPQSVYRTLILCDPATEKLSALALVRQESDIPPVKIGDWTIACVGSSFHLLRCRVGDVISHGLVVSINGSPMMTPTKRRRAIADFRRPPINQRKLRLIERAIRRLKYERFLTARRVREQEWQNGISQFRRAKEEKERAIYDKLIREREEQEAERKQRLDEWDRERRNLMHGTGKPRTEIGASVNEAVPTAPDTDPHSAHARAEDRDSIAAPPTASARTSDVGSVLTAFAIGCIAGYFLLPRWFSLVGSLFAAGASVWLRLAGGRSAERN